MKSIGRIAGFLNVTPEYLLTGVETEKAPALTEKDKRDVAKDVAQIMDSLEDNGELMFDGVPMSDEARASMAAAMRIGLEEARGAIKKLTPRKSTGRTKLYGYQGARRQVVQEARNTEPFSNSRRFGVYRGICAAC